MPDLLAADLHVILLVYSLSFCTNWETSTSVHVCVIYKPPNYHASAYIAEGKIILRRMNILMLSRALKPTHPTSLICGPCKPTNLYLCTKKAM